MIDDCLTSGAISGITASIIKTIPNSIFYFSGVIKHSYPSLIATIILRDKFPESLPTILLGLVIDFLIGGFWGMIIAYLLKKVSRRYLWFKGIIFGSFIWLIFPTLFIPLIYPGLNLNFHYVSLFDHWLFGLFTVYFLDRLNPSPDSAKIAHQ